MAGARVTITVDDADLQATLNRLADFGGAPLQAALGDVGEHVLNTTRDRAARQQAPDGTPWVPLSPKYAKRKEKKRPGAPILKFDLHLLGDRLSYQLGDGHVDIGTSALYGATHQFGRGAIPARPFLGLSAEDERDVLEILGEHLELAIDGR